MERITATYFIETPSSPKKAAEVLAGEQSSGTFVAVPGETAELKERFAARVESVELINTVNQPSIPSAKNIAEMYHQAIVAGKFIRVATVHRFEINGH
jgi:ribulose-bisphosphate carboxylase large chain